MAQAGLGVALRRRWRQFRQGPVGVQVAAGVVVVAVVGGIVAIGLSVGSGGSGSSTSVAAPDSTTGTALAAGDSTRGVTATTINVVFPVIDVAAIQAANGFANSTDESYQEAIRTYVADINNHGGINGRKIVPQVVTFNPSDDADMRAKCLSWTKDESVFAVVDAGAWHDDHQLCVTQEGHTPLISSWTTVTDFADRGAPYLWWAGADQGRLLHDLVPWAVTHQLIGPGVKFSIVASDRASDTLAVNNYLKPALAAAGLSPVSVETINYNPQDNATAEPRRPVLSSVFALLGVTTVIPLMPLPAFLAYMQAANSQQYYPKLALSDYEQTISIGLGMAESLFKNVLDGQLGMTYQTLGNSDDPRLQPAAGIGGLLQDLDRRPADAVSRCGRSQWRGHHRVAGSDHDRVPEHPVVRRRGSRRRAQPHPQDLHRRHGPPDQLPGGGVPDTQLQPDLPRRGHPDVHGADPCQRQGAQRVSAAHQRQAARLVLAGHQRFRGGPPPVVP